MYYFLNLFFVFSIIGFILEQGIMLLINKPYNSSLLQGPWTIVYGIASLIILWIGNKVKNSHWNKYIKFLIFFVSCIIVLSILEFCAGFLIEKILGIVYWDYTNYPLNLGKYVCVYISLGWTIYACILNYLIYPWGKKLIQRIPKFVTYILIVLFFIDIGYSIMQYFKYQ